MSSGVPSSATSSPREVAMRTSLMRATSVRPRATRSSAEPRDAFTSTTSPGRVCSRSSATAASTSGTACTTVAPASAFAPRATPRAPAPDGDDVIDATSGGGPADLLVRRLRTRAELAHLAQHGPAASRLATVMGARHRDQRVERRRASTRGWRCRRRSTTVTPVGGPRHLHPPPAARGRRAQPGRDRRRPGCRASRRRPPPRARWRPGARRAAAASTGAAPWGVTRVKRPRPSSSRRSSSARTSASGERP